MKNDSKIPKINPGVFEGLIFGGAYIRRDLSTEGYLRFKKGLIFGILR